MCVSGCKYFIYSEYFFSFPFFFPFLEFFGHRCVASFLHVGLGAAFTEYKLEQSKIFSDRVVWFYLFIYIFGVKLIFILLHFVCFRGLFFKVWSCVVFQRWFFYYITAKSHIRTFCVNVILVSFLYFSCFYLFAFFFRSKLHTFFFSFKLIWKQIRNKENEMTNEKWVS